MDKLEEIEYLLKFNAPLNLRHVEWLIKELKQHRVKMNSIRFYVENPPFDTSKILEVLNDETHDGI